jgi:diaminopimelate epimerase
VHTAKISENQVALEMTNVSEIVHHKKYSFLNTGSPHHIERVENLSGFDVYTMGKKIRNNVYGVPGANVNFVSEISENTFEVRTYERGVEDETLSCGTGVTGVAIAMFDLGVATTKTISLKTLGGRLTVSFQKKEGIYTNVVLEGAVKQVFKGIMAI